MQVILLECPGKHIPRCRISRYHGGRSSSNSIEVSVWTVLQIRRVVFSRYDDFAHTEKAGIDRDCTWTKQRDRHSHNNQVKSGRSSFIQILRRGRHQGEGCGHDVERKQCTEDRSQKPDKQQRATQNRKRPDDRGPECVGRAVHKICASLENGR